MITGFTTPVYSVGRVVERELSVLNEGKEKWAFETDVFSNGYRIFLLLGGGILNLRSDPESG